MWAAAAWVGAWLSRLPSREHEGAVRACVFGFLLFFSLLISPGRGADRFPYHGNVVKIEDPTHDTRQVRFQLLPPDEFQELWRVFTQHHDIYVQDYLFDSLRDVASLTRGTHATPFSISWADCSEGFSLGLEIDLTWLPSLCQILLADIPYGQFVTDEANRIPGFRPKSDLSVLCGNRAEWIES